MEKLQKTILLAAKLREESYDKKTANKALENACLVDYNKFYRLSLYDAVDQAASTIGFGKKSTMPVYLLLKCCWNDIIAWAEEPTKEKIK